MFKACLLALCKIVLIVVGWFVVAAMIPLRKTDESTRLPNGWVFSNFPGWWGNPFDGLVGDRRMDYLRSLGLTAPTFWSMWKWAARRNPVNKWSRLVAGVDVSYCVITKRGGQDVVEADQGLPGWQYLVATHEDGRTYPRFFAELPWFFRKDRMLLIDIGWKIKLSHNGTSKDAPAGDRLKGLVFVPSPWKGV